jgi:hypothetical protein
MLTIPVSTHVTHTAILRNNSTSALNKHPGTFAEQQLIKLGLIQFILHFSPETSMSFHNKQYCAIRDCNMLLFYKES